MTAIKKVNPDDPNVRDPEHKHELGGTLGMAAGGAIGGVGAGAATAAVAGGAVAGPAGAVIGAAIGGAIGGAAGEAIAREVNPTLEEKYWEENYHRRPYAKKGYDFESYRPAYRVGVEVFRANPEGDWESLEPSIQNNWDESRGTSSLEWDDARPAARDAFDRLASSRIGTRPDSYTSSGKTGF